MRAREKVNILMVDDQPAKLLSYESILDELGENLIKANSGREALELLLKNDIAVVLMDVSMPELDGFELAEMIRQHPRFQKTAIIFISAVHLTDLDRLKGYERGAVDYISVPVIPELLRAKVSVFAERKRSEQTQARLVAILEAAPDFIGLADAKDRYILYVNRAGRKMTGLGEEEDVTKLKIADVHPEWTNQMLRDKILPAAIRDGFWAGECAFLHRDGHEIPVLMALHAHKTSSGEVEVFSTISRDITQRKQAEEALERQRMELARSNAELSTANKELEAFSYSVSHDLRAPLRQMVGFSKILLEESSSQLDSYAQRCLRRIQEAVQHMARLVDDLLNLGHVGRQALHLQPTALKSLVLEALGELKPETEGREMVWQIGDLPVVECDPSLMKLVFANLLSNAIKFTRAQKSAVIEVGQMTVEGQPVIFVRDNGVGFNMRYVEKLFGIFQRLHHRDDFEGTGVGLANVQRIVHKHGGRVWAEAEPYKGATFYFTLVGPAIGEPETNATARGGACQQTR
jgi:PAS domain S-box-containing protein